MKYVNTQKKCYYFTWEMAHMQKIARNTIPNSTISSWVSKPFKRVSTLKSDQCWVSRRGREKLKLGNIAKEHLD